MNPFWLAVRSVAALSILALGLVSCAGSVKAADTHVGREEPYRSGNFDYDEFFEDVYGLQSSAKNAEADEKEARAPLGQALGVGETSLDRLLEALRSKAQELYASKARIRFALDGVDGEGRPLAGKTISVGAISAARRPVPKEALRLAAAMGQTAEGEGQVWEKYSALPEKGRRLVARAAELRGSLDGDFAQASKSKRQQVEQELEVAGVVSGQIADSCDKVVISATRFLKEGGAILVAAAVEEAKPEAKSAKGAGMSKPAHPGKPKEPAQRPRRKDAPRSAPAAEKPAEQPQAPPPAEFNP